MICSCAFGFHSLGVSLYRMERVKLGEVLGSRLQVELSACKKNLDLDSTTDVARCCEKHLQISLVAKLSHPQMLKFLSILRSRFIDVCPKWNTGISTRFPKDRPPGYQRIFFEYFEWVYKTLLQNARHLTMCYIFFPKSYLCYRVYKLTDIFKFFQIAINYNFNYPYIREMQMKWNGFLIACEPKVRGQAF